MKTPKNMLSVLLVFLVSFSLSACGGGSGESGGTVAIEDLNSENESPVPVRQKLIAADHNGDIWQIDENDGSSSELLDVYVDDGFGNYSNLGPVSAMVYDVNSNRIFAGTGAVAKCKGCIYTIDPSTGEATLFMVPGVKEIPDMAVRSDGKILVSYKDYDYSLYVIDPSRPYDDAFIGALDDVNTGLGVSVTADDTLFLGQGSGLESGCPYDGAFNFIRELSFADISSFERVNPDFSPASLKQIISQAYQSEGGNTFAVIDENQSYPYTNYKYLVKLDVETAEVRLVAGVSTSLDGLAFVPIDEVAQNVEIIAPGNVLAASGPASVTLTWDKVFSASYNVYWSSHPGVSPSSYEGMVSGVTKDFYSIEGVEGDRYYATVTMVRNGIESTASDEVFADIGGNGAQIIDFAPETRMLANAVTLDDDDYSAALPIGFSFEFFGSTYTEFVIFSNGFITFDKSANRTYDSYLAHGIPSSDSWNSLIALAWVDLSPNEAGSISYETLGVAPNRRLVVNFEDVTYYGGSGEANLKTQAILYEGTNIVEIHTSYQDSCGDSDGVFDPGSNVITQGVENADGTEGYFMAGRVLSDYSLANDAVRFYTNF